MLATFFSPHFFLACLLLTSMSVSFLTLTLVSSFQSKHKITTLSRRMPQDWRYYNGQALTSAEIYKIAEDTTGSAQLCSRTDSQAQTERHTCVDYYLTL